MDAALSPQTVSWFFAGTPFVVAFLVFVVTFFAKRKELHTPVPIGQTHACAQCGRRGVREHMLPKTTDGNINWYCTHCSE